MRRPVDSLSSSRNAGYLSRHATMKSPIAPGAGSREGARSPAEARVATPDCRSPIRWTRKPRVASARAEQSPATPSPMTTTSLVALDGTRYTRDFWVIPALVDRSRSV